MKTVYYSTLFLTNRDRRDHVFLQSIIVLYNSVYNSRGNAKWVNSEVDSDLLVIGKDTDSNVLTFIPNNIRVILSLSSEFRHEDCHIIYIDTPLKVTNLIDKFKAAEDILVQFSSQPSNNNNVLLNNSKKLKLLQWPAAEIIAKHTAYPILSALLSKRPMGFEELVNLSKKSEEFCRRFVDLIVNAGFAEYITIISTDGSITQNNSYVNAETSSKRSLLDRIRSRLGLFWN